MNPFDSPAVSISLQEDDLLAVLAGSKEKTLSPPEIAHAMGKEGDWHALLAPIRKVALDSAKRGRVVIYRKGKPIDPADLRGVYRIGLPRQD